MIILTQYSFPTASVGNVALKKENEVKIIARDMVVYLQPNQKPIR